VILSHFICSQVDANVFESLVQHVVSLLLSTTVKTNKSTILCTTVYSAKKKFECYNNNKANDLQQVGDSFREEIDHTLYPKIQIVQLLDVVNRLSPIYYRESKNNYIQKKRINGDKIHSFIR
jgi:hypothetical protein